MSQQPKQRLANFTPERLAQLAERDDTVVYTPVHDIVFVPWSAERVRKVVAHIVRLTRTAASQESARALVLSEVEDAKEFSEKYTLIFAKITDPVVANNASHIKTILHMIEIKNQVDQGKITEKDAQSNVCDHALAGLLAQAQGAASTSARRR